MNEFPVKLKGKDIKPTRTRLLEQQSFKCALCMLDCSEDQAVLDHNHQGGHVRAVLHRGCNATEGKIMNSMRRYGIKDPLQFLESMIKYQQHHAMNQTGLIHPTFKTPEEKIAATKKRVKRKRKAFKKSKIK